MNPFLPQPTGCQVSPAVSRRQFVAQAGGAALAVGLAGALPGSAWGAPKPDSPAEQAIGRLFKSLSAQQRTEIALPWDDPRRTKVAPNWLVTKSTVDKLTAEQQKLVHEIVQGATSPDGFERILKQTKDDGGGLTGYAIAVFGVPGEGKSSFLLTGRHLTLRADGNTTANVAFGGPLVYGHGVSDPAKSLYHYQTKRANEVFLALDGKQRETALLGRAPVDLYYDNDVDDPRETSVELLGARLKRPGISVGELSSDQRELVKKTLADILAPYRKDDVDEALALVEAGGGWEKLNFAFYQEGDLNDDGQWDVWRIEGPTLVAHFRGAPHVHAYLNIAQVKQNS